MPLTTFLADLLAEGRFVGIDSGNRILGMSIWLAGLLFTSLASVPSMFAQGRRRPLQWRFNELGYDDGAPLHGQVHRASHGYIQQPLSLSLSL